MKGIEVVDEIAAVATDWNDKPRTPVVMERSRSSNLPRGSTRMFAHPGVLFGQSRAFRIIVEIFPKSVILFCNKVEIWGIVPLIKEHKMAHTVMVTGADGFIGSHLTEELVKRGEKVRAFCLYNSFGSLGWIDTLPPEIRNEIDVFMGRARPQRRAYRHARAGAGVPPGSAYRYPFSYHSPDSYVDTNIKGTLNVLNAARELGTQRVMVTSTSEVYGTAQYVPIDEKHPFRAKAPTPPPKLVRTAWLRASTAALTCLSPSCALQYLWPAPERAPSSDDYYTAAGRPD